MEHKIESETETRHARVPAKQSAPDVHLVCLNFKVPFEFRRQFKVYAAERGMTMTGLLSMLFDEEQSFVKHRVRAGADMRHQEMKK
jgi:hypothetical protein